MQEQKAKGKGKGNGKEKARKDVAKPAKKTAAKSAAKKPAAKPAAKKKAAPKVEVVVGPMRDRAAYMRWYRAQRKANSGMPIGRGAGRDRPWAE